MRRAVIAALAAVLAWPAVAAGGDAPAPVSVGVDFGHALNTFSGDGPLGVTLDGHSQGETAQIYTRANLMAMRSTGYGRISYRLRTELGAEAWHWNPRGHWSDPRHQRGYWVSDAGGPRYAVSYGYRLPRRGDTIDQANNDGYSRLDDGDPHTFWKSNPYLDPRPQWLQVDLGAPRPIDGAQLDWSAPYARRVRVQFWTGALPPWRNGAELENEVFAAGQPGGAWHDFARQPRVGAGGRQRLVLGGAPVTARYVRVLMSDSSHTHTAHAFDVRDRLGFAMYELHVGVWHGQRLLDWVRHGAGNRRQSIVWVSSTDPWHRASDLDRGYEQPSFDTVFASGLRAGRPVLMPAATLYGVPADAANEARFLRRRGYPVSGLELGEEPDGQLTAPEDYAALYVRFAGAVHASDPRLVLGGPSLSTSLPDWTAPPDATGRTSWTGRFVTALRRAGALGLLRFFSFEWYPVDDVCSDPLAQLHAGPQRLAALVARQRADGLPAQVPLVITELGWSPFAAQAEVDLPGALLDADAQAQFLARGGRAAYVYGLEPDAVMRESRHCPTFGNLALWRADDSHRIRQPLAALYAEQLLTRHWLSPHARSERMYATSTSSPDVGAYAVRAGGRLSLLLVNRSRSARDVAVAVAGPGAFLLLSPRRYVWHARGARGYAAPDRPPILLRVGRGPVRLSLPGESLGVLSLHSHRTAPAGSIS